MFTTTSLADDTVDLRLAAAQRMTMLFLGGRAGEVLLRHKRLRVLLMHAGWPFLESTVALLCAHPNVYVNLGALQAASRPAYSATCGGS